MISTAYGMDSTSAIVVIASEAAVRLVADGVRAGVAALSTAFGAEEFPNSLEPYCLCWPLPSAAAVGS